jgi:diacylglycerol kinase (ATP)
VKRLYRAGLNSLRGLRHGVLREAALREEVAVLAAAVPLAFFLAPSWTWYVAMLGSWLAVLAVELLNTAIERLADHTSPQHNPDIGVLKDYGSAAVFCMLCLAGLIWLRAIAQRAGLF